MGRFNFGKAIKKAAKDGSLEKAVDKMEADLAWKIPTRTFGAIGTLPIVGKCLTQ